jgi:DNA-binding MarR family transcriptional regulator
MAIGLTSGEALRLWHAVHMHFVRDEGPDLSARQMAILLIIYLEAPPHTVRGLAGKLAVSKPVITRALDSMGKHDLVTRRRDDHDRRNVLVQRTVKGALFLERVGDTLRDLARHIRT